MEIMEQTAIKALLKKTYMNMHLYKTIIIHAGHFEKPPILQNDLILGNQIISKKRTEYSLYWYDNTFICICLLNNNNTNTIPRVNIFTA